MYGQTNPQVDPVLQKQMLRRALESRQNMLLALVGGLIGAAIGAALWAVVMVVTDLKIGIVAIVVGWLAGQLAWKFGRGLTPAYGVVGAVCALIGVVADNVLGVCAYAAKSPEYDVGFFEMLGMLNFDLIVKIIKATFVPLDPLFYLIALYEGWKFSFRQLAV